MGIRVVRKIRVCKNSLCGKEFIRENWRKDTYCCRDCVKNDPNYRNGMKGRSNLDVWIEKYGERKANEIYKKRNNNSSLSRKKYLSSLTQEERKVKYTSKTKPTKGKRMLDMLISKYGKKEAESKYKVMCEKNIGRYKGKKRSLETIAKIRIKKLERVEREIKKGVSPRYNPTACKIIDQYGKENGYNFQHAENGGEVHVKDVGCYLDGYDKKTNTVIEFYERFHYSVSKGLKQKELNREQLIIGTLKCSFIRVNAYDKNNLKYEIVV